jgi:predicted PurR-regulated permease PerM
MVWLLFREVGIFILLVTALVLLWPHRRAAWAQSTLRLLVLLGLVWILHKARMVVYPLLAGILVAYWLAPLVDRLERRRVPRALGALLALLPTLAIGTAFILLVAPMLVEQLGQLVGALPRLGTALYDRLLPLIAPYLPTEWQTRIGSWLAPAASHIETVLRGMWSGASGIGRGLGALLGFLAMVVLAPVMTYYLLVDFHRMRNALVALIPEGKRDRATAIEKVVEATLRSYFRGQALVALCIGITFTTGFLIIRLPYALVLGFLACLLNLVPVIGFWTTTALCALAAVLSGAPGPMLLRLGIVLATGQVLESQLFTPRIVGHALGLNPAVILFAILVFGTILGPLGVLIAVPGLAVARTLLEQRRSSRPLQGAGAAPRT